MRLSQRVSLLIAAPGIDGRFCTPFLSISLLFGIDFPVDQSVIAFVVQLSVKFTHIFLLDVILPPIRTYAHRIWRCESRVEQSSLISLDSLVSFCNRLLTYPIVSPTRSGAARAHHLDTSRSSWRLLH